MKQKETWEDLFKKGRLKWYTPHKSVEELLPLFKKRRLKTILDLGCGSGRHTVYLGKKKFFVVGSDISLTGLKKTKCWLKKEKVSNYCLVENDMTKLPFADKCFDAIISVNTIHHNPLRKIKETVGEINRIMKKDGLVFVTITSVRDYKFGFGKKLEKNTYLSGKGTVHHFFDEKNAKALFHKFKIKEMKEVMDIGNKKSVSHIFILNKIKKEQVNVFHWHILAEKL